MSNSSETSLTTAVSSTPFSSVNVTDIISTTIATTTGAIFHNATTVTNATIPTNHTPDEYDYVYKEYDEFMYPGYKFERPIYMFVWEFLVILTCLVNILVIIVLLRRSMRTPTNMILVAIAISDSLTGLVTLPSYIMVFQRFDPCPTYTDNINDSLTHNMTTDAYYEEYEYRMLQYGYDTGDLIRNETTAPSSTSNSCTDGYLLTKSLCRFFMISKFFVSKSFHTMSIWLTLYLGFQRYISVAYPFKSQNIFTVEKTLITCTVIAILAPVLHIYHLLNEKAMGGMCQWQLEENCEGGCAHLWISFLLRHFIPCVLLVMFSVLFIMELLKSSNKTMGMQSGATKASMRKRTEDNRRISIIVTAIVVVFLIPEIPYGGFLLVSAIKHLAKIDSDLEGNRGIHAAYEILLVLSFQANFFIYTFYNKRFRRGLKHTFKSCLKPFTGLSPKMSFSRSTSFNTGTLGRTGTSDCMSKSAIPLDDMSKSASLTRDTDLAAGSIHEEEKTKFIESNTFKDVKL